MLQQLIHPKVAIATLDFILFELIKVIMQLGWVLILEKFGDG